MPPPLVLQFYLQVSLSSSTFHKLESPIPGVEDFMKRIVLAVAAILFWANFAYADSGDSTIYTYTGNPLDQPGNYPNMPECACSITGSMTFAQPLDFPSTVIEGATGVPTSYSFSVDGYTLDQNNSTLSNFSLGTDEWLVDITGTNGLTIYVSCL